MQMRARQRLDGNYLETKPKDCPSEDVFRIHMERLLNPDDAEVIDLSELDMQVYLASIDDPFTADELLLVVESKSSHTNGAALMVYHLVS